MIIALDIYGTILATEDPENELPIRQGSLEFLINCRKKGIGIVSTSDAYIPNVRIDLREKNIEKYFNDFVQLDTTPKDYSSIIETYNILPEELIVIGDNFQKDIEGARRNNCFYIFVKEYLMVNSNLFEGYVSNLDDESIKSIASPNE